jgi:iron complex outermembrane receptor protein
MSKSLKVRAMCAASSSALAVAFGLAMLSTAAHAADASADGNSARRTSVIEGDVEEVIVIAPKNAAATVAPVKSSLTATEPTAVIDRAFIEQNTPTIGDYTTTSSLAVSMVSAGNANGPGSTDGAKLSLRGVSDGQFNITYDGIPWGDTNGPSHHAQSFFPNSTIGGVIINRGPGDATDIGQASFGGSLNLFSLPVEDQMGLRQKLTIGSWDTWQSVTTLASGPLASFHDANFIANFQEYGTKGYLTNSPSGGDNQYLKMSLPVSDNLTVTALYTRNDNHYNQSDISNGTVAEIEKTGQANFALCNDQRYSCYKGWNYTKKQSDFEYLKEAGEFGPGIRFENTTYSYWYSNKTLSANTNDYATPFGATTGGPTVITNISGLAYPAGGAGYTANKVPGLGGYWKRNEYRVTGDVIRFSKDIGPGELTLGGMYEVARTKRFTFQIALPVAGSGVTGFSTADYGTLKAAKFPTVPGAPNCYGYVKTVAPGKTYDGACQTPLDTKYNEYSGWHYYQVFSQYAWKVNEQLTITPGVKYLNYELYIHAPVISITQPLYLAKTYDKTLGFLTVNYRFTPYWTAYGQASQGFLVPSIGSMYVNNPNFASIQPQQSMAYQLGTVYSHGNLTFDADIYNIDFQHKLQSNTINDAANPLNGQTYFTNSGGATYQGIEGQATYVFLPGMSAFANLSVNKAIGKDDAINPGGNGKQLAGAPRWTSALGLRSEKHDVFMDDDSLVLTLDSKWIGPQMATAAAGTSAPTGLIKKWAQANFAATYQFGQYAIQAQILNVMDKQPLTAIKGKALIAGTNQFALTSAQGGAANSPQYLTPRSYQITLKAAF